MSSSFTRRHTGPLAAWGRLAVRRRFIVLFLAVDALFLLAVVASGVGGRFADEFELPGVESQRTFDLLRDRFPARAGESATLVLQSSQDLRSEQMQSRVERLLRDFSALPEVIGIRSPYADGARAISPDGTIGYATIQYGTRAIEVEESSVEALFEVVDGLDSSGLHLEIGGPVVRGGERSPPGRAEVIGLAAASVILLIAFGSVVSMGVPMVTALFALGSSLLLLAIVTRFMAMSTFTPAFVGMIGIGVGIDYALFVVTRFREELARGGGVEEAVGAAVDTAGRAVIFAGVAVVIALVSLFAVGIPFIAAIGVAGGIVVAMSVLIALVLLPALLGLIGTHIGRWRVGMPAPRMDGFGVWYRFAQTVQRHPLIWTLLAAGLLLLLAAPALDMRLGSADAGNNPTSFRSRRAYDLLSEGFGPGFNGPLVVAIDAPRGLDIAALGRLREAVAGTEGVALAGPALPGPAGDAAVMTVIAETSPQDERTGQLIEKLRSEVLPAALAGTGMRAFVGGQTALFDDISERIVSRLPLFFGLVIGLSFVLLMVVFRSFAVPLKAALMNLLAIGSAYGVLVAIFQWGWFGELLGVGREGPIESFAPMMLFAILFGLSMDYEVFLLSRIRENYMRGASNREAVALGVGQTARVITAAAAIMVAVFMSFALAEGRVIKQFGLGLATAIFVDATIVRLILVPAVMGLLGDANWWFPGWLDRLLPRVQVGGERVEEERPGVTAGAQPQPAVDATSMTAAVAPSQVTTAPKSAEPPPLGTRERATPETKTAAPQAPARRPARDYMRTASSGTGDGDAPRTSI